MTHWVSLPPCRLCWWTGCEALPFTMGPRMKRNTYHVCYHVRIRSAWTSWYRQGLNAVHSSSCSEWAKMTFLHLVQVCLELVNTSIVNWWDTSIANWWLMTDLLMMVTLHSLKGAPAWLLALPEMLGKLKRIPLSLYTLSWSLVIFLVCWNYTFHFSSLFHVRKRTGSGFPC